MDGKKTLPLSWIEQISQYLLRQPNKSVALVGVGNPLMGDDAAGILVVQRLKASLPAGSIFIPIDAGPTPENFTGTIRKLQPGLIVFIDAGEIGEEPGSVALFTCKDGEGISAFGHSLPLGVLGQYLEMELGCECLLLIIQPGRIDFDEPVTEHVKKTIDTVSNAWLELSTPA
jgi:hydrogenase 3 maturation protease